MYKRQTYYLLDNEFYFNRPEVYGAYDDGERFAFFSRGVLEVLPLIDFYPDVLHCNDWHTALIPVLLDTQFRTRPGYENIHTVFTIHNIEFQGKFDPYILGNVCLLYTSSIKDAGNPGQGKLKQRRLFQKPQPFFPLRI